MRVINAGLGRTGTHSLKAAFWILGLGPCYSAEMMWSEPGHAETWRRACDGEQVDWPALFAGYRSGLDWPVCAFWRELTTTFPDMRVLLSLRDPEQWFVSFRSTVHAALTTPMPKASVLRQMRQRGAVIPVFQRLPELGARVITRGMTETLDSREEMIAAFERHNAAVRAEVPADRLLVWEVSDGWEPLCAFLGVPVPNEPFPKVNDRKSYRALLGLRE
jgi:Sulfotransferase domain